MNRLAITCLFLVLWFPLGAATNLPPATSLLLDDTSVIPITAELKQYDDPPKIPGQLTSIGSGVCTILINRWATEFASLHPETELNIQGGGSVDGFAKLLLGQTDLVPISRSLSAAEIERFKAKFGYEPAQIVVAQDAVGVYVNKDNPIAGLTLAQLDVIYSRNPKRGRGQIEFWGDLGVTGPLADERITRLSLGRVHGSHMFLQEEVMQGEDYRFDVQFEAVPSSRVQGAGADPAAIGCASIMFATARTRFVPLQARDGSYLLPSYTNTANGRYPLIRPMRIVFQRKPDGTMNEAAREFLRFAVSRRGQRIIALAESYPLTIEQQQEALRIIGDAPPGQTRSQLAPKKP